jgi:hypothetical protein
MTERLRRYAVKLMSLALLLVALRNAATTARELWRFYTNLPVWDAMDYLTRFAQYRSFNLSALWMQHNEHRILGTDLLFATDMLLFHGRQLLPLFAGIALYGSVILLFTGCAFYGAKDKWTVGCSALLAAAIAVYKVCAISLANPFLCCWPQLEFFTASALAAGVWHKRRGGKLMLVVALMFAIAATYSLASGMFVWPVLLGIGLVLHYTRKEMAVVAAVGVLSTALYFYRYQNMHSFAPGPFMAHPLYALEFLGSFLGMPFSTTYGNIRSLAACVCGWIALLILLADAALIVRKRLFRAETVLVLGGYCVLTLIEATLTAIGRMHPGDPYFLASRAGRYLTEPELFWCALLLLTVWLMNSAGRGFAAPLFVAAVALAAGVVLPKTEDYYSWWRTYYQNWQWAEIAVANGVMVKPVSDILYVNAGYVRDNLHVLVDNRLAIFSEPEPWWIGRRAVDLFARGADGRFHGEVTTVKKLGEDYEIQGWVDGADGVVFVDDAGRIIGFGMLPRGGPVDLYSYHVPRSMTFTGFIRGSFGAPEFSVWALNRKQRQMFRMGERQYPLR